MKKPYLGAMARERSTGLTGLITSCGRDMNGQRQWGIQPQCEEGKLPDTAVMVDELQVEVIGHGIDAVMKAEDFSHIPLGSTVRCRVSNMRGILTGISVNINGCSHGFITAPERRFMGFTLRGATDTLANMKTLELVKPPKVEASQDMKPVAVAPEPEPVAPPTRKVSEKAPRGGPRLNTVPRTKSVR